MTGPTAREIDTCSDNPSRFRRMLPTAQEVLEYSASHHGRLPSFVFGLTDAKWRDLADTLRELDMIAWVRKAAA